MKRKDFLQMAGMAAGAAFIPGMPIFGRSISVEQSLTPPDTALHRKLADIALNAATSKGANYADVRIGRYLNQFLSTREKKVQNIANTESYGMGIRVIAKGCWGFASTDNLTPDSIAKTAELAVRVAIINAKLQTEPVILAPQKGYGTVSWKTPIEKNAFEVPIKDKIDLLLSVNAIALDNGARFANSSLAQVNEQKY